MPPAQATLSRRQWGAEVAYDKAACIRYGCDETPCLGVSNEQLQKDLQNTVVWSGRFGTDYCFYVANWHGLLGILCCHPDHPFNRASRLLCQLVSCSLVVYGLALECGSESLWPLVMGITLFDAIYGFWLYFALSRPRFSCCGFCRDWLPCRALTVAYKGYAACTGVILTVLFFSSAMLYVLLLPDCNPQAIFRKFLDTRLRSYLVWFPMMLFMPCCGFWMRWSREFTEYQKATQIQAEQAATRGVASVGVFQSMYSDQGQPLTLMMPQYVQPQYIQPQYVEPNFGPGSRASASQAMYIAPLQAPERSPDYRAYSR